LHELDRGCVTVGSYNKDKRKKFMRKSIRILTIIVIVFLAGCSVSGNTDTTESMTGIRIAEMDTAVGGIEGNLDEQVFSYHLTLLNTEPVDVVVHWIEPVLEEHVSGRVLIADRHVIVEKTLAPNTYLEISGGLTFDTQGATKMEIMSWEPFITGIKLSSEITLSLPGQAGK
jgi:hypothetical protein